MKIHEVRQQIAKLPKNQAFENISLPGWRKTFPELFMAPDFEINSITTRKLEA